MYFQTPTKHDKRGAFSSYCCAFISSIYDKRMERCHVLHYQHDDIHPKMCSSFMVKLCIIGLCF